MLCSSHGRLGDTIEMAEYRYGVASKKAATFGLVEGAKEMTFEFQGWRIRCAFLKASDEKDYVVREEYTKIWNNEVMKAGGSPTMKDYEVEAVLKRQAGQATGLENLLEELEMTFWKASPTKLFMLVD